MEVTLPPEIEDLVQRQIASGKYKTPLEVIIAGLRLLDQPADTYQGRLLRLQQDAQFGWSAVQQGAVVDGTIAIEQLRTNLQLRYGGGV
jgi:antitoxin ParD1/3/4